MGKACTATTNPGRSWHRRLPTFASLDALRSNAHWSAYLDQVYGLDTLTFPFDLRRLTTFYSTAFESSSSFPLDRVPLLGTATPAAGYNLTHASLSMALDDVLTPVRGGKRPVCGRHALDAYRLYHHPPFSEDAAERTIWLYGHHHHKDGIASNRTTRVPWLHPINGFPSHTKIEVLHCAEECATKGITDYWLYHAPGSGIYFDLGKTLVVRDRCGLWRSTNISYVVYNNRRAWPRCVRYRNAWDLTRSSLDWFGGLLPHRCPGFWCGTAHELMRQTQSFTLHAIRQLIKDGYDSVQFTNSEEHGIYKYEIIDLRQHAKEDVMLQMGRVSAATDIGSRVCPGGDQGEQQAGSGRSSALRHYYRGWEGRRGPCVRCSPSDQIGLVRGCFVACS